MPMGAFEYRVKRVPDPVATISNSKGGNIGKNLLMAGTLIPILENFDFKLFFKITGFKMTITGRARTSSNTRRRVTSSASRCATRFPRRARAIRSSSNTSGAWTAVTTVSA